MPSPWNKRRSRQELVDLIELNCECQTFQFGMMIMTSVDLIRAAAICPFFRRISRTASAVMIEVMCCSPSVRVTCASRPLILMSVTYPMS